MEQIKMKAITDQSKCEIGQNTSPEAAKMVITSQKVSISPSKQENPNSVTGA